MLKSLLKTAAKILLEKLTYNSRGGDNLPTSIEEWETREDLDDHIKSDRFSVLLGTKSLLCEPPQIEIHTVSNSEGMETIDAVRSKRIQ
jgi:hypothetical protein